LTAIADIGTFLYAGIQHDLFRYEINPIVVILELHVGIAVSVILTLLTKILINTGLIWLLLTYKPGKTHIFAYMLIYGTLFAIILQGFGAYSNMHTMAVVASAPEGMVYTPLEKSEALNLFKIISLMYYVFSGLSLLAFAVYEQIYRLRPKPESKVSQSSHS
jgi:hypothetical protein